MRLLTLAFAASLLFTALLRSQPPLPEPSKLIKEVQAHQTKMDQVRENYTFHRVLTTHELDAKGAVKKTIVEEREIFFVNGHQIGRLIKRDGQPLNDSEEQKEQDRTRKLTIEYSKKPPAFGKGGGLNMIDTVLSVAEISHPRRIQLNGRATLAFDFKGNPKAEAHTLEAKAIRKIAGTVWIDENDRQVARLEVEFYDNFRVAGGLLANIQKGTVIKIDQSPIGEGLWMQTATDGHINLRVVAKSVNKNTQTKNFDFKRFNVDAAQQISQPQLK